MLRSGSSRWLVIGGAVLAGLLLVVLGLRLAMDVDPTELGRLVSDGPIKELREELRPARPGERRVILFAIDGVGDDAFREILSEGRIPELRALLGAADPQSELWDHAWAPRGALSILPSTTFAAWTSVFTGSPVGETGVPGNEWYDRASGQFLAPAPVSVSGYGDAVRVFSEGFMDDWIGGVPTLFERADVRSYAVFVAQHRGADLLVQPDLSVLGEAMAAVAQGIGNDEAIDLEPYEALDRQAAAGALAALDEYGLPDLLAVYLPGIDLHMHVAPESARARVDYFAEIVAPLIWSILEAYRERKALEDTWVVFVSDHGHTPVSGADRNALGTNPEEGWAGIIEEAGWRLRPFERDVSDSTHQAVLAYQGAFANVYLADRSTCRADDEACDWSRGPDLQGDLVPLLQRLHEVNLNHPDLAGTLDLILSRESHGLDPAEPFQVWDGDSLRPVGDYLESSPRPDLLAFEERLRAMGEGPLGHRAGDILLLARMRIEDSTADRFYFSGPYRSWHGSPNAWDSQILWILARPGGFGSDARGQGVELVGERPGQLDITPLVLGLLSAGGDPGPQARRSSSEGGLPNPMGRP